MFCTTHIAPYTNINYFMSQSLSQYLLRVGIFLALVFIIVVLLYPVLQEAFLSNNEIFTIPLKLENGRRHSDFRSNKFLLRFG